MFSHVMLGVNNLEASRQFYDALLGTLGVGPGVANKDRLNPKKVRYFVPQGLSAAVLQPTRKGVRSEAALARQACKIRKAWVMGDARLRWTKIQISCTRSHGIETVLGENVCAQP